MSQPTLTAIDHLVLTVEDIARSVDFYTDTLGMAHVTFDAADGTTRHALTFGAAKINLHEAARPYRPHAECPTPGSADLCFLTETPLDAWIAHLATRGVTLQEGPVPRTGARAALVSIYIRDPDGNLIEIAQPRRD